MLDQFLAIPTGATDTIADFFKGAILVTVISSITALPFVFVLTSPDSSSTEASFAAFTYPKTSSSGYFIGLAAVKAVFDSRKTGDNSHENCFCKVSRHH